MPLLVGLTGGIASGKSTIAKIFEGLGALIIDADALVHEVQAPGQPGLQAIVETFGSHMLQPDGTLDRSRLAQLVFGNTDHLETLNSLIHPLVQERFRQIVAAHPDRVIVHDIPLLVELDLTHRYHLTVVAMAPAQTRIQRMVDTRGIDAEQAQKRIEAQASDEERRAAADIVIDTKVSVPMMQHELHTLWENRIAPYANGVIWGKLSVDFDERVEVAHVGAQEIARLRDRVEYFTDGQVDLEVGRSNAFLVSSLPINHAVASLRNAGFLPVPNAGEGAHDAGERAGAAGGPVQLVHADPGLAVSVGLDVSHVAGTA